jgi:hypothetical protein
MKKFFLTAMVLAGSFAFLISAEAPSKEVQLKDCFFLSSLHHTTKGMAYWYSKEMGGLETLTGVPYAEMGCKNCHGPCCDTCHKVERDGKAYYSTEAARNPEICLNCHGREKAMMKTDSRAKQEDVHYAQGMVCADCHSQREMHGDGIEYKSMKEPGAMDTRCENCHDAIPEGCAHDVHQGKLDCKACHVRHVFSCTNCHFDTLITEGKKVAIPLSGWLFLMNYEGKISSANMQNYVVRGNKTFLMFAPHMSHSIMKEGRTCDVCHGAEVLKDIKKGEVTLTWLEEGEVVNRKGLIPVVEDVKYKCVYHDFKDGKWIPIENPAEPVIQYAAFGKPLTEKQLQSLSKSRKMPLEKK